MATHAEMNRLHVVQGETHTKMQNTRAAVDKLTQLVQKLIMDGSNSTRGQKNYEQQFLDSHFTSSSGGGGFTNGSNSGEGIKLKSFRLEFPRFDGDDPDTWCCQVEQFFDFYDTPDAQ